MVVVWLFCLSLLKRKKNIERWFFFLFFLVFFSLATFFFYYTYTIPEITKTLFLPIYFFREYLYDAYADRDNIPLALNK